MRQLRLYSNIGARKLTIIYIIQAHLHFQLILKMWFFGYRHMYQKVRLYGRYHVITPVNKGRHVII